jgi:hypothetical protein
MLCVSLGNLVQAEKDGVVPKGYCGIIHNGSACGISKDYGLTKKVIADHPCQNCKHYYYEIDKEFNSVFYEECTINTDHLDECFLLYANQIREHESKIIALWNKGK